MKAAVYACLSGSGGVREEDEGEEPRYMVNFTKKIWEEVTIQQTWWCTVNSLALVIFE